jgi:hypothetical protein
MEQAILAVPSKVGRLFVNGECMNRQDRHAKPPPLEIPVEMLAGTKPVAPKPVISKAHHPKHPEIIPPKHGLPT